MRCARARASLVGFGAARAGAGSHSRRARARCPPPQVNRFWSTEGRHRESSDANNTDDIQNYLARRTLRAKEKQALERRASLAPGAAASKPRRYPPFNFYSAFGGYQGMVDEVYELVVRVRRTRLEQRERAERERVAALRVQLGRVALTADGLCAPDDGQSPSSPASSATDPGSPAASEAGELPPRSRRSSAAPTSDAPRSEAPSTPRPPPTPAGAAPFD